ncbi:SDR family NAD(P)-dependent oxidoreductase [Mycolicibacterium porcinum]|uniref:SDR family NAD(P)-dependent oxidoreductase n=1 Tax=Mycolicibacterium porcinum TaxID=39693 RepID=UPI001648E45F|nr:SDR family oxidoreductase [Mycolicibacterium porcinum]
MSIPTPTTESAALVTGASSGIGRAIAVELATAGHNLVLVARRRDRLEILADELRHRYGVQVDIGLCDLSDDADLDRLIDRLLTSGMHLNVLILCAGFGMVGPYLEHDEARLRIMLRTNIESTMSLARALMPAMAERRQGAVLLVSSMAGNQPSPSFAPYAATKAAISSLGEALHHELRSTGVTVSVLAPAHVATEFADVADATAQQDRQPAFMTATPEQCAKSAIRALHSGKRKVTPLPQAVVLAWVASHLPRPIWFRLCGLMMK